MTTVRLPLAIEQKLDTLSKAKHTSKTELIKEALQQYFGREESEKGSYERGAEYFGHYGSGDGTLSANYKKLLKDKINVKFHSH